MLKDLVIANRSYRRFDQSVPISESLLRNWIDHARCTASTVNSQALKYCIVCDPAVNAQVFETLAWAGLLRDWPGPAPGERPAAYVVMLCDLTLGKEKHWDEGIAAQTILLAATEAGFGGCMLGSIQRQRLAEILHLDPARYAIDLVLALGKPAETVKLVPLPADGSTAYYRDAADVHCVPKRALEDLIVK